MERSSEHSSKENQRGVEEVKLVLHPSRHIGMQGGTVGREGASSKQQFDEHMECFYGWSFLEFLSTVGYFVMI
ncbi:hypothetical protein MKW98_006037 [Papaver atlanticum]|uniref:Uncharacterized protein n=1 Tax=Papaver atlanticum TaxID=357466 RepID=A0AAD4XRS8_9MAGN|nr:hypothetical protein MKW98_006037 [Papaver atlanticum]